MHLIWVLCILLVIPGIDTPTSTTIYNLRTGRPEAMWTMIITLYDPIIHVIN